MDNYEMLIKENLEQYDAEEREMLILTGEDSVGAGLLKDDLWQPGVFSLATIDIETNTFISDKIRLRWLAKGSERKGWIYDLKPLTTYRIKARHIKEECKNPGILNDVYYLASVIEREISDDRLEQALEEYKKPKYLTVCDLGEFKLEKVYGWYAKDVNLSGETCRVLLECDPAEEGNADVAKKAFEKIYSNFGEWNLKIKKFAAGEMTDLANDWAEEGEKITEEEFINRLKVHELWMNPTGGYSIAYYDDDMFAGHYVTVEGDDVDSRDYAHL